MIPRSKEAIRDYVIASAFLTLGAILPGSLLDKGFEAHIGGVVLGTSANPMVIDERELYRRQVVAIAVGKPQLAPGEHTEVFVISENFDD